jgi:hypothetical protein
MEDISETLISNTDMADRPKIFGVKASNFT